MNTRAPWLAVSNIALLLQISLPAPPARPALSALPALLAPPTLALSAPSILSLHPLAPAQSVQSAQKRPRLFPPEDLGLLEAPDRDDWNKPDLIMDALGIADGATVADLGAGGGWFTIRLARRVGPNGIVYAQDIQPQMIEAINRRVQHEGVNNVRAVMGTSTDPRLPVGLDVVLIVDAYHEMDEPSKPEVIRTLLKNVAAALKPQGRVGVVDFLPGGGGPGPAAEDRVDPDAVIRAADGADLKLQTRVPVPPFQYLLVFGKASAQSPHLPIPDR